MKAAIESNIGLINEPALDAVMVDLKALVESSEKSPNRKWIRLKALDDRVAKAIAPGTPCKKGCAHCCNMPTLITGYEAKIIEQYSGIKRAAVNDIEIKSIEHYNMIRQDDIARFMGVPCPFISDNHTCSIYEQRPHPCRIHHTVYPDNSLCVITDGEALAPSLDLRHMHEATARLFHSTGFADIRDFFPTK